jgi:Phosphotransferase enzyme family
VGLPIPETPDDLTPEWLTAALTESGVLAGDQVVDARRQRVGAEYGFTGIVVRIELEYEPARGDLPRSLIAKLPMAQGDSVSGYRAVQERDPALMRRYYERCAREQRFYSEIGAHFAPTPYYAAADGQRVVLLLEDLSGGRQGDVLVGCSIDEAALVLDELARFHARWWGERAPRDGFERLVRDGREWQERYGPQVETFLERHGERVPPVVPAVASELRSKLAAVAEELYGRPRGLTHNDLHLDNVLFDARGEATVVVLDWQTVAVGAPAWDVTLFLVDSLGVEDRRAAEAELWERYVAGLAANGGIDYSLEDLRLECRLSLLLLLAGTVGWLANLDEAELTGRERALQDAALDDGRLAAALADHEVEAMLAGS